MAKTKEVTTNLGGRPTKYDPSFCDIAIELGKQGKSFHYIAGSLGVSYRTLCTWRTEHEEFLHALELANTHSQMWWEDQGQTYLVGTKDSGNINASLYGRSMAARFPDSWRENVKLSGDKENPVEVKVEAQGLISALIDNIELTRQNAGTTD
jgi:hypothetical protein